METPKHHEIIRTFKDFGGMIIGLIVPDEALELPRRGAAEMLDRELYDQPEIPGGDWDSLRGV